MSVTASNSLDTCRALLFNHHHPLICIWVYAYIQMHPDDPCWISFRNIVQVNPATRFDLLKNNMSLSVQKFWCRWQSNLQELSNKLMRYLMRNVSFYRGKINKVFKWCFKESQNHDLEDSLEIPHPLCVLVKKTKGESLA